VSPPHLQIKLEAQYAMKLEAALNDGSDLKQQLVLKNSELKHVNDALEQVRTANAELEVRPLPFTPRSHGPLATNGFGVCSGRSRSRRQVSRAARTSRRRPRTWSGSTRPSRSSSPTLTP